MKKKKIVLIVGHCEDAKGARLFDKNVDNKYSLMSEFNYNKIVAEKVGSKFGVNVIYRNGNTSLKSVCDAIEDKFGFKHDVAIELHFNAFNKKAFGTEVLITDECCEKNALIFVNEIAETFNIKKRRGKGVKWIISELDRGYSNLQNMKKIAKHCFIAEPFFGNFSTHESKKFASDEGVDKYAEAIVRAITKMVSGESNDVEMGNEPTREKIAKELLRARHDYNDSFKNAIFAQWMLETGRFTSELFKKHWNVGGMKFRTDVDKHLRGMFGHEVSKAVYTDSIGDTDSYFSLKNEKAAVDCYEMFIRRDVYNGWEAYKNNPKDFIRFIARCGYCPSDGYAEKVINLIPESKKILDKYRNEVNDNNNDNINESNESTNNNDTNEGVGSMNLFLKYLIKFILEQFSNFGYKKLILLAWNKVIHSYLKKLAKKWDAVEWDDAIVEALDRLVNNFCDEDRIRELELEKIELASCKINQKK